MSIIEGIHDLQKYDFTDTSFDLLMQKRIRRVLIICSNYDNYMLEEDGRIDEYYAGAPGIHGRRGKTFPR